MWTGARTTSPKRFALMSGYPDGGRHLCLKGIHHLLYATGCIIEYDAEHTIGGQGFTEEDSANFHGSFYSHSKVTHFTMSFLSYSTNSPLSNPFLRPSSKYYTTTCTLRVRMPISDDLSHRNFVTKIVKYDRVVNIPNSMTTLTDMLPVSLVMAERKLTGIFNFCNPGAISHKKSWICIKSTLILITLVPTSASRSKPKFSRQGAATIRSRTRSCARHCRILLSLRSMWPWKAFFNACGSTWRRKVFGPTVFQRESSVLVVIP